MKYFKAILIVLYLFTIHTAHPMEKRLETIIRRLIERQPHGWENEVEIRIQQLEKINPAAAASWKAKVTAIKTGVPSPGVPPKAPPKKPMKKGAPPPPPPGPKRKPAPKKPQKTPEELIKELIDKKPKDWEKKAADLFKKLKEPELTEWKSKYFQALLDATPRGWQNSAETIIKDLATKVDQNTFISMKSDFVKTLLRKTPTNWDFIVRSSIKDITAIDPVKGAELRRDFRQSMLEALKPFSMADVKDLTIAELEEELATLSDLLTEREALWDRMKNSPKPHFETMLSQLKKFYIQKKGIDEITFKTTILDPMIDNAQTKWAAKPAAAAPPPPKTAQQSPEEIKKQLIKELDQLITAGPPPAGKKILWEIQIKAKIRELMSLDETKAKEYQNKAKKLL